MSNVTRVRFGTNRDIPLITSSWLKSYRNGRFVRGIPSTIYFGTHHRIVAELITQRPENVVVLCSTENEDDVLGWMCYQVTDQALIIHYIYVKYPFRNLGTARTLVETIMQSERPVAVFYTHDTPVVEDLKKKVPELKDWIYNPYLIFDTLPDGWLYDTPA